MQRQFDFGRLVLGLDDALLQVEPVVGADGDAQEAEAADGEHAAEQGQRLPATGTHSQKHGGAEAAGTAAGRGDTAISTEPSTAFWGNGCAKASPSALNCPYLGRAENGR